MDPTYDLGPASPIEPRDASEQSEEARLGRRLLEATRPFATESLGGSWWRVLSTLALLIVVLAGAGWAHPWPLRTALASLGALLLARAFITYHDFMHGAILRGSRAASLLFQACGAFMLTPPRSWKKSHNHHHGHVGQICTEVAGAFPIITTRMWHQATRKERTCYRISRHPLTVILGYVTVFGLGICLLPLLKDPKRHWDSALSLVLHGGSISALWAFGGFDTAFFVVLLPMSLAAMLGSYLFFAQHSFTRMIVLSTEAWSFYRAALVSSSYMRLNKLMHWFTGNIGYHHVHHLNVRIPFYRLSEAMAAIPELQSPMSTSLSLREIVACFRSSLWDEDRQRMVSYREA